MYETLEFDSAVTKMRKFFKEEKGFTEVPTQSRLSILAACEDPKTISQFVFDGINYPLPQTGQMWLEYELLTKPDLQGVFCVSTSGNHGWANVNPDTIFEINNVSYPQ